MKCCFWCGVWVNLILIAAPLLTELNIARSAVAINSPLDWENPLRKQKSGAGAEIKIHVDSWTCQSIQFLSDALCTTLTLFTQSPTPTNINPSASAAVYLRPHRISHLIRVIGHPVNDATSLLLTGNRCGAGGHGSWYGADHGVAVLFPLASGCCFAFASCYRNVSSFGWRKDLGSCLDTILCPTDLLFVGFIPLSNLS